MLNGTDGLVYTRGTHRFADLIAVVVASGTSEPHADPTSLLAVIDGGEWQKATEIDSLVVDLKVTTRPLEQFALLTETGRVHFAGSGDQHNEQLNASTELPLRGLGVVEGTAIAVGMGYQVLVRDAPGVWRDNSVGLPPAEDGELAGFEAIAGFSKADIYAAGWHGEIWRFDGARWRSEATPTNVILADVLCSPTGTVFACGRQGMLLAGRAGRWDLVLDEEDDVSDDFWSLAWFNEELYVASEFAIYVLRDGQLEEVAIDLEGYTGSHYQLSVADHHLCSVGARDILLFDGKSWTRID